jgi:hypothetical protein
VRANLIALSSDLNAPIMVDLPELFGPTKMFTSSSDSANCSRALKLSKVTEVILTSPWLRIFTTSKRWRLRLRFVAFGFEEGALEGEVGVLGEGGLEIGKGFLRGRGVAVEQIDRGHCQELGRR